MLDLLLTGPVDALPCENVAQWWPRQQALGPVGNRPFGRAIAAGFAADRVGWAFAAGYQAALRALFPDAPDDRICAFCVSEADGNSPKAINSSLRRHDEGWLLNGAKRWTTLGANGSIFFVAARDETDTGTRPAIRIVRVSSDSPALKIEIMAETTFVPEVPHARLQFENLRIADTAVLPGDGYANYVKPFRTVEDIYVNAAILAYLAREARRLAWPQDWLERCATVLVSMEGLAGRDPAFPATHIALAGALSCTTELASQADRYWERSSTDPAAARWKRDRALFGIAARARAARTERAWQAFVGGMPTS